MKKKTFYQMFNMVLLSLMLVSCKERYNEPIVFSPSHTTDIGGAGDFKAINMATNDTLYIDGAISIYFDGAPRLNASNGNIIKLVFEEDEKYKDYKFNTTFTLHDSTEIKGQYQYEYAISNAKPGDYRIRMSAEYIQKDDNNDINLYAGGGFVLNIVK